MTIPGLGELMATALGSAVGDAAQFKHGRQFAAWLGLMPRQHRTGGKSRLLGISKRGTGICAPCWCTGPGAVCGGWIGSATAVANGRGRCWNGEVGIVQPWRWPIEARVAWVLLWTDQVYCAANV